MSGEWNIRNTCETCKKDYTSTTMQTYIYSCNKTGLDHVRICAHCLLKHAEQHYPGSPVELGMKANIRTGKTIRGL